MHVSIFVTVRMKSRRLPRKAMRMIEDKPMIEHMIDRLKLAKLPDSIVLCTSTNPDDDVLIGVAKKTGIGYFRGSELDVLDRLLAAAEENDVDLMVNATGDNPFTDPIYIDKLIRFHLKTNADYSRTVDLPLGANPEATTTSALRKAREIKDEVDTEFWTGYFTESGKFRVKILEVEEKLRKPNFRLTVDTPEDLKFVREIFRELYEPGRVFSLKQIIKLVEKRPELLEINKAVKQEIPPKIKFKKGI